MVAGTFRPGSAGTEWCDVGVLRTIERRAVASLRKEVEPVDGATYTRFLLSWHGLIRPRRGLDALRDAVAQLEGYPLPASMLERVILPARVEDYTPAMLDALCATGEVAWFGAGRLRAEDGRVVLAARERLAAFVPPAPELPEEPLAGRILDLLRERGALFFTDIVAATGAPLRDVLGVLWDLVWGGFITNDTLAPLRAWARRGRDGAAPGGRLRSLPPEAAGRWSVLPPALDRTRALHAWASAVLERRGVAAREAVNAEAVRGGFSALYPVFREMEERGRVRRGYFVEGVGGAQFALPGTVDRLRAEREPADRLQSVIVAAVDPAQPYGELLPWPAAGDATVRGPARTAGNFAILVDGRPVLALERWGKSLLQLPADDPDGEERLAVALDCLCRAAPWLAPRGLTIERIDGEPAAESPLAEHLARRGFAAGYRGLTLRTASPGTIAYARG